jgi:co-chaperonin GroES (HSP10)
MQVLANNILVEILKKQKTNTGIIITSEDETSLHYAKVVKISPYVDQNIKLDNIVCFPKLTARKFKYNNQDLALITESDVILVFEDELEAGV